MGMSEGKQEETEGGQTRKQGGDRWKVRQEWIGAILPGPNVYKSVHTASARSAGLIIACGGDGTLLQTAHLFKGSGIPILGINIGYLGFITSVEGRHTKKELHRILDGEFVVSERTALDLTIHNHKVRTVTGWALNDAVITRGANPHLITLRAKIGNRPLTDYRCDDVIVSTPT